jgi:two-component system, OmpR family, phosphate regulon sensor histidine kinase PhoR
MLKSKWFFHPLFVFIFSIIALGTSLFIYISSYIKVNDAFRTFVLKHNIAGKALFDSQTWVMILITSVLVALIITGLAIIFVYYQKMINLYRRQQNFINGFTHELKTPVASLQLLIDTFIKHDLPRSQQLKYFEYMLGDTKRISDNVNQILNLANIEEKKHLDDLHPRDVTEVIEDFIEKNKLTYNSHKINLNV